VQCLPLRSLLAALNVTHVDVFSLDTEGGEQETIRNFPFDSVTLDVLIVENQNITLGMRNYQDGIQHSLNQMKKLNFSEQEIRKRIYTVENFEKKEFVEFVQSKGYYLFDIFCEIVTDFVFVRIESELFKSLKVPADQWNRTSVCADKILPRDIVAKLKLSPEFMKVLRDAHHYPSNVYKSILQD